MTDVPSSITRTVPRKSMLFHALRETGIEDLRKSAARSWTDHNVHDPGITLLEALCYVVTELSNQLNFSFADLIATPKGIAEANINYPSAATTLSSHPVSATDFRKIILDLPGIRNAYFEITRESKVPVYYDPALKLLTYAFGPTVLPLQWGGLYAIQLEFEDDDLNANFLTDTLTVPVGTTTRNIDIIISFKYWDEIGAELFKNTTITAITLEDTIVILDEEQYDDYYAEWKVDFSDGSSIADFGVWVKTVEPLDPTDPIIPNLVVALENALKATLATSPFVRYKTRLMAVQTIVEEARSAFHLHRNLGEDLSLFLAMRIQEIAIDAAVEIRPSADPVEICARILFAIESFFTPRPGFRSLKDLLAEAGFKVDEIFLGPLLNSGFLSGQSLNILPRNDVIYVSDLVHIIMDVDNTVALRDISLSTFFNNFETIKNERNCLKIRGGDRYKPRLSVSRSKIALTRNGVAVTVDQAQVAARLAILRSNASALPDTTVKDLDIPIGSQPEFSGYRSVQFELPITYGTGDAGIPASSTPERRAQLRQLQGYLFFFDQLLANTYSQLANVGDLFSVHQQGSKTYHFQTLYHLPGAKDLIGHLAGSDSWTSFIASEDNEYLNTLVEAGESADEFFQRRTAFLDYLLARTGEDRHTYSGILASIPASSLPGIILREKEMFLEKYPALSKDRSQAYNYLLLNAGAPDVWDTANIGGFERMICHKLGFPVSTKRILFHPLSDNFEFFDVNIPPVRRKFRLKDNFGNSLVVSQNHFADDAEAKVSIRAFLEIGRYQDHYQVFQLPGGTFSFRLVAGLVDVVYDGATLLATRQAAENVVLSVISVIGDRYSLEGLHVVEHILLRPRIKGATDLDSDKLMAALKVEDSTLADPYSNIVTVLLPSGMEKDLSLNNTPVPAVAGFRMRNPEYKRFAAQTILREAPAHLMVNIFLLDIDTDPGEAAVDDRPSLQNFERKFKAWREATADPAATIAVKRQAQRRLVTVLEKIYA